MNINTVIIGGKLTRDVELKYTPSGTAVAEIGLAINRYWFDKQTNSRKEETTFVDVTLWGRDAEVAGEYLAKGSTAVVEGHLKLDTWDDKQTGAKRSKLKIVAEHVHFGDRPREGGKVGSPKTTGAGAPQSDREPVGAVAGADEEVPF